MSRYRGIPVDDLIRCKIFGKSNEHSIQAMLQAGCQAYPGAKIEFQAEDSEESLASKT